MISAAKSIFKRAPGLPLKPPEPTALPDPLEGAEPMKFVKIDPSLAPQRKMPQCQDTELGWDGWGGTRDKNHHEICSYPFTRPSISEKINRDAIVERLNADREAKGPRSYNVRTKIEPGKVELGKDWPEDTTEWSNNPGTRSLNHFDACQLCTSVDDNYIIPRGFINKKGVHQCVCKKWAQKAEKFMVCNCDLCDAFTIPQGLRDQCMKMAVENVKEKYLSRYVALNKHNVFIRLYNDVYKAGKAIDDTIAVVQKDLSVCRSGQQGKKRENHSGKLFGDVERPGDVCPRLLDVAVKGDQK